MNINVNEVTTQFANFQAAMVAATAKLNEIAGTEVPATGAAPAATAPAEKTEAEKKAEKAAAAKAKRDAKKAEKAAAEAAAKAAETPAAAKTEEITLDGCRAKMLDVRAKFGDEAVAEIFTKLKITSFKEVTPELYAPCFAACEAKLAGEPEPEPAADPLGLS